MRGGREGKKEKQESEILQQQMPFEEDGFEESALIFRFRSIGIFNCIKITYVPLLLYGTLS